MNTLAINKPEKKSGSNKSLLNMETKLTNLK